MNAKPDISIIIEMENVLLSKDERCLSMFRQLRKQICETGIRSEVIVLFNPEQIDRSNIEPALSEHLRPVDPGAQFDLRLIEATGKHYYELKNEGAAQARGDIVVFLDSDVIPDDDWLTEICTPFFDNPDIDVVAGNTYLSFGSLKEKAFALGWFFPLRNPDDSLHPNAPKFWANNVAFRRDVILANPFPAMIDGIARGACRDLAHSLVYSGTPIWTNTAAHVCHPPPADIHHFTIRALVHGRDNILKWSAAGLTSWEKVRKSYKYSRRWIVRTAHRMKNCYKQVNLPLWQVPAAFSIMVYFYTLAFFGSCVTMALPDYAKSHWQI